MCAGGDTRDLRGRQREDYAGQGVSQVGHALLKQKRTRVGAGLGDCVAGERVVYESLPQRWRRGKRLVKGSNRNTGGDHDE